MKKLKRDIWEETPFKLGIYKHKKTGKIAIAKPSEEKNREWEIDKGKTANHPLFRIKVRVTETGIGNFFFNKSLKDYEWVSELKTETLGE